MQKRGRILKDTSIGKGIISSDGVQYEFELPNVWKSDVTPATNMVVNFIVDADGAVTSIFAVSEGQLAKEQADKALDTLKGKGLEAFDGLSARVGKPVLVATSALAISWFFLNTITIQVSSSYAIGITFWNILGVANATGSLDALQRGGGDTGIYGLMAVLALAGPFLAQFWKDPRAHLGNCLPLLLLIFIGASIYMGIQDGMKSAGSLGEIFSTPGAGNFAQRMAEEMISAVMKSIHFGPGLHISIAASIYLALLGLKKYLAAKA